jgi:serine phosphatase RsbU (regulator of sigma subunit)
VASGPDASLAEAIEALRAERPVDLAGDHPVAQMIRGADSLLLPDVPDDFFGPAAQSEALGIRPASAIVVPLKARRSLVGALSLVRLDAEAEYDADDLLLARTLARRAALTIESAQAWIQTRNISKTLQASLLPRGLPEIPGLQLVGRYRAAAEGQDVGGDFYDAFEIADGRFGIAIGDVCGKGPEAAALTALARYTIRAVAERGPAAVLTLLNTSVLRDVDAGDRFLTALFAEVSQSAAGVEIEIAVAGHPPPLVRRADGEVERIEASGPLVGVVPAAEFATTRVVLAPGDRMLLYTDGLTDARAPRAMLSEDDLGALLSAGHALDAEGLAEFLELSATGDEPARDDIAIVVLEAVAGTDAPVTIQRYASES